MRANEFIKETDDDDHGYLPTPLKLGDYRDPYNPRDYGPYDDKFKDNQDLRDIVHDLIESGVEPAVVMISPRQLTATQDWLADARYRDSDPLFDEYEDRPVVLKYNGVDYILDGHHRCSSALRANQKLRVYLFNAPQGVKENFADGKKPGRKGLAKRVGVNCKQPVGKLRKIAAASSGERQRMAHWCANMKSGKNK